MSKIVAPFYAGIGSRDTPTDIIGLMEQIGIILREQGYILRSGHADGADKAFEKGSDGVNQIWLPWKGFNYADDGLVRTGHYALQDNWMADKIAAHHHPAWNKCDDSARKLHTRNVYQVLGPGLGVVSHETMSKFVVCWTKDGKASGGTGQALRIAAAYNIPVFNLFHDNALEQLEEYLSQ
jgi:hypothetical protein